MTAAALLAVLLIVAVAGCAVGLRHERTEWTERVRMTPRRSEFLRQESERSS